MPLLSLMARLHPYNAGSTFMLCNFAVIEQVTFFDGFFNF